MKEATIITLFSLACLLIFMCVVVLQGHNNFLIYAVLFVFSTAAGVMLPQPGWVKGEG